MAWTYVNGASAPAATSVSLTASLTTGWSVTAGNLLVVTVSSYLSHGTVNDNVNNTNYNLVNQNGLNGRNCTIILLCSSGWWNLHDNFDGPRPWHDVFLCG